MRIWELPRYSQVIQPWQFGDNYTKRTCLWLRGLPELIPSVLVKPEGTRAYVNGGSFRQKGHVRSNNIGVANSAKVRSKTFPGIAKAIAEQWSAFLSEEKCIREW